VLADIKATSLVKGRYSIHKRYERRQFTVLLLHHQSCDRDLPRILREISCIFRLKLHIDLIEKDRTRKRNRTKTLISKTNLKPLKVMMYKGA
jgi:hypothetical protein